MRKKQKIFSCRKAQKRTAFFVLSVLIMVFLFPVYATAAGNPAESQADDFRGSAVLKNEGDKQYKGVRLTAEIYRAARENLADLRIFAQGGQPVPYFLHRFSPQVTAINESYPMTRVNSFTKGEFFYYDYAVKVPENEDVLATSLLVATEKTDFAKQVEVFGSYDNQHWEKITDVILYRVEGKEQLEIPLGPPARKFTHYRFKIANNLEKISFSAVTLNYNDVTLSRERFTDTFRPEYTVEEQGQKTLIKLSGLQNIKLDSITLETDSIFKRRVIFADIYEKMLYNLHFQETEYSDLILPLAGFRMNTDTAVLVIENNDDQPIEVKQVLVKYYADEVIFNGAGRAEFVLKFGNQKYTEPPAYDLVNYQEQILQEGYDLLPLRDLKILPAAPTTADTQPQGLDSRLLFNAVIVAVTLILGVVIIRKLKNSY